MLVGGASQLHGGRGSEMQGNSALGVQREYSRCPACKELWIPARVRSDECPICDVRMVPVIPRFVRGLRPLAPGPETQATEAAERSHR